MTKVNKKSYSQLNIVILKASHSIRELNSIVKFAQSCCVPMWQQKCIYKQSWHWL